MRETRTRKEWKKEMKMKEKVRKRQEREKMGKPKNRLKKFAITCLLFAVAFFFLKQSVLVGYTQKEYEVEAQVEPKPTPKNSKREIKKVKFKKKKVLLAEHTIYNPGSGANRNENMRLAAEIINGPNGSGYLLKPGEKFSWLEVVGNTTAEKGFLEAGVIRHKKSTTGLGGGVCQVSSAINSSVIAAGLETHAQKHSLTSSYIHEELGDREATVSYDSGIDFWFENTLENPIEIRVIAKGGDVTVKVWAIKYQKI